MKWYPIAGALLLGAPVAREFYLNRYPLSAPEALTVPVAAVLLGMAVGWLLKLLREPWRTLGFVGLVGVFLDLQFDLEQHLALVAVGGATLAVVAGLRRHRALLAVVCLAAFTLSSLPLGRAAAPVARESLFKGRRPVLLHLILDAQWGPAGLRAAGDPSTASFLESFYLSRGFRLYQGAYARYSTTNLSLGSLVALGAPPPVEPAEPGSYRLTANPYFDSLATHGYHARVYQTTHLDFCPRPKEGPRCQTASANSLGNVGYLEGSWSTRAELATRFLLNTRSYLYREIHPDEPAMRRSSAGRAIEVMESVRRAIAAGESDAYFVHVLLPHPPFEVDSSCVGYADLDRRLAYTSAWSSSSSWKLEAYGAQTRCAHRLIDGLLRTLDSVVGRDQSVVVIHGDHGARLQAQAQRFSSYDPELLNDQHSTLLAVRAPQVQPGVDSGTVAIQTLFQSLVQSWFARGEVPDEAPYVITGPADDQDTLLVDPADFRVVVPGAAAPAGKPATLARGGLRTEPQQRR